MNNLFKLLDLDQNSSSMSQYNTLQEENINISNEYFLDLFDV